MSDQNRTEISELGEFGLIDLIKKSVVIRNESSLKGIGDDAAVIKYETDSETVISTDMLVEGVHFDLAYVPLKHLGYKAVMVNISDIIAMNAVPRQITFSLSISNRFPVEAVEELYAGVSLACEIYNVDLIGGDTTTSLSGLTISVTAIGEGKKEKLAYRDGVKESNLLVVTGDLGGAYMGLQILEREKQIYAESPKVQPDLEDCDYILERQLKPEARKDISSLLKEMDVQPTAMIDISDGLSSEVMHICSQSEVGCKIYEDKIPLDPQVISACEEFDLDSTMVALSGGEDYELLFTVPIGDFEKVKGNPHLSIIGHITDKATGLNLVTRAGQELELKAQGWNALAKEEEQ